MNYLKRKHVMPALLLSSTLLMLSGCVGSKKETEYIVLSPQPAPLSKPVLQAMQPNSTELSKRASTWSTNSKRLLDSVKTN